VNRVTSDAKGLYRTRGRHSAATVRGTKWLTADRCDGTLTKVKRGKVVVRDFRRKKSVALKAGQSYLAKAPG
jgi:ferric-dicitrate binding protein FerR (iron transport regulator)